MAIEETRSSDSRRQHGKKGDCKRARASNISLAALRERQNLAQ
jgi:hypothetical protein